MSNQPLFAPWRMDYIRGLIKPPEGGSGCFICEASGDLSEQQKRERLVLWGSEQSVVLINRYPYTNGHLMVAPRAHKAELEDLSSEELLDLQVQTTAAIALLKRAMSPQGFNIGINLGRSAGA
jgi:ATP adenylyltransferase